jgi:MATE family multidrug resistance protein
MSDSQRELKASSQLALPVVISQVGNMSMGMIDTYVVGQVGPDQLAGVAAGNSVFWTATVVGSGILFGLDPMVAQAYGRQDATTCNRALSLSLVLGLIISTVTIPVLILIGSNFHLTGATPNVVAATTPYLNVIAWGFPLLFIFHAFQRYWQGLEIAAPLTIIIIIANVLNYFSDIALVQGAFGFPALGAQGVAYSTLICRGFALVAVLGVSWYLWWTPRRNLSHFTLLGKHFKSLDWAFTKAYLRLGLPAAGQIALEVFAFNLTTILVARLGTVEIATHHIVMTIASFTFMFPLGLSSSTAVRVGYHLGRKNPEFSRYAGYLGIRAATSLMGCFGLILYLFPDPLIGIFTTDLNVLNLARDIIFLCSLFQVFDGLQVVTGGALRGLGDTKTPLWSNLLSHYVVGLPLGLTLCFAFNKGLYGLWIGIATGLFLVALINLFIWNRKSRTHRALVPSQVEFSGASEETVRAGYGDERVTKSTTPRI